MVWTWVVLGITILTFNGIVIRMRKRLRMNEIMATIFFALFVEVLVDTYACFKYKAWGFFNPDDAEFSALFVILGIYPAAAAMIINWYPYRSVWWKKSLYLLAWAVFSTSYEWLALKVGILWHQHWSLVQSFFLYPVIYYMLIAYVRFYRWLGLKGPAARP